MYWAGRRLSHAPFHGVAYSLIRRQIHTGSVLPGEQLPAERKLADTLGISRATLRDALKRLEQEGYVVSTRGVKGGNFIADGDQIAGIAKRYLLGQADDIWRSFEFLEAVLNQACILACGLKNPSDVAVMSTAISDVRASETAGYFRKGQYEFLMAMCHASLNRHLVDSAETAMECLFSPDPGPNPAETALLLDKILHSILSANHESASLALSDLLNDMSENLLRQMMSR